MAYGLKYWQYVGKDEARVLVQVYVKDWSGRSYEMAHITGASLQLVGGNSDVLTPVIKTAFSWSLVDAWDQGTTQADGTTCVDALGRKCGEWEEFFTPDATKFKVVVSAAPEGALLRTIWTGYVTPDSWSEDLIYHGIVTITARDMLGALNEMEFSMEGRPSVLQLVQGALSACSFAMPLTYDAAHFLVNSDERSIINHTLGAMTFSGDTWWTALTDTLESLGLVLRWDGRNQIVLTSLRYLAEDTQSGYHTMEFINRTGLRELAPALKLITETFDVDRDTITAPDPAPSAIVATGQTMVQHQHEEGASSTFDKDVTINKYQMTGGAGEVWNGYGCVPRPDTIDDGCPDRSFYFVPDLTTNVGIFAQFKAPGVGAPLTFTFNQDGPVMIYYQGQNISSIVKAGDWMGDITLDDIELIVTCKVGGSTRYLTENGWNVNLQSLHVKPGDLVEVPAPSGEATDFSIMIEHLTTKNNHQTYSDRFFVVALDLELTPPQEVPSPVEFKTTTEYDQANNVTITRRPKVGSAATPIALNFSPNVLGYDDAAAADEWNWPGEETFFPLAVMIQAQVLCYYSAPASVFTGTAHDGAVALPGYGLRYYGRDCVIVSGTYDFTSGYLSQLNAREVYSWEDVWGESFEPEYVVKTSTTKGGTSDTGRWSGGQTYTPSGAFNAEEFSEDFQITQQ